MQLFPFVIISRLESFIGKVMGLYIHVPVFRSGKNLTKIGTKWDCISLKFDPGKPLGVLVGLVICQKMPNIEDKENGQNYNYLENPWKNEHNNIYTKRDFTPT